MKFISVTIALTALALTLLFINKQPVLHQQTPAPAEQRTTPKRYLVYIKENFDGTKDKKRVLFFHAPWCPTCRPIDKEFSEKMDQIPEDVVVFKTDYDTEKTLKQKYTITYQHTFVFVDASGNEVKKWNDGGLAEVIANTK